MPGFLSIPIVAVVVLVVMPVVTAGMVPETSGAFGVGHRRWVAAFNNFFELAFIEPYPPATRAKVYFNSLGDGKV